MGKLEFQVYSIDLEKIRILKDINIPEAFRYFESQMERRGFNMMRTSSKTANSSGDYPNGFAVVRRESDKETLWDDVRVLLSDANLHQFYVNRGFYSDSKIA